MFFYFLRQLLLAIPALLGVVIISFVLMRSIPGDVVDQLVGIESTISAERKEEMRRMFGLDLPIHQQFVQWFGAALQGDLGSSLRTKRPILPDLLMRFPVTLELTLLSLSIALLISIPLGIIAALNRGNFWDALISIFALLGLSIPGFFLGILLILLFSLTLNILPPAGYVPLQESLWQNLRHMLLPATALGLVLAAAITRIVRSSMLEVLQQDYIRTARAKGLRNIIVTSRHALRNALIPIITVIGLQFGSLLGGTIIIEQIFSLPGIGRFALEGINLRDYPVVQGTIIIISGAFILVSLLLDMVYALIDPRIRYA